MSLTVKLHLCWAPAAALQKQSVVKNPNEPKLGFEAGFLAAKAPKSHPPPAEPVTGRPSGPWPTYQRAQFARRVLGGFADSHTPYQKSNGCSGDYTSDIEE